MYCKFISAGIVHYLSSVLGGELLIWFLLQRRGEPTHQIAGGWDLLDVRLNIISLHKWGKRRRRGRPLGKVWAMKSILGHVRGYVWEAVITETNRKVFFGEEWCKESNKLKIKEHKRCGGKNESKWHQKWMVNKWWNLYGKRCLRASEQEILKLFTKWKSKLLSAK